MKFLDGEIYGGFFSIPGDLVSVIYIKMFTYLKRRFEQYTQTETFADSDVVAFFYLSEFCYDIIIYHHLKSTVRSVSLSVLPEFNKILLL